MDVLTRLQRSSCHGHQPSLLLISSFCSTAACPDACISGSRQRGLGLPGLLSPGFECSHARRGGGHGTADRDHLLCQLSLLGVESLQLLNNLPGITLHPAQR
nr:hypothetical protein [Pseudomonas sp. BIGb0427]